MPVLRIKYPTLGVITHVLRSEYVTVGRAADNSIQIPHASISNHHAEIRANDGVYRLRDLGSTNHSLLNGERVAEAVLTDGCIVTFGSIECQYDAHATTTARPPEAVAAAAPAPQTAFLENENRELRAHVTALQRRFDILGSARLTAGQADRTPSAVASDALRGLSGERDELRQQVAGLRLEVNRLREELAVTARERDAARQAAAGLQSERTQLQLELQQADLRIERLRSELIIANESAAPAAARPAAPPPARPPSVTPPVPPARPGNPPSRPLIPAPPAAPLADAAAATPPPVPPAARPPAPDRFADPTVLPASIGTLRERITQLAAAPSDRSLLADARREIRTVLDHVSTRGAHPLRRLAIRFDSLLESLGAHQRIPTPGTMRTLRQGGELLERLLDPGLNSAAADLPTAQVLAIDDDPDLLATVSAALGSTGLEVSGCVTAEEAMIAIEALRFDTIIADIGLPGLKGTDFCAHARSRAAYRRTPILFLTGADSLEKRAETSLNGGTEFIAKPFDTAELALKVEAWTLKHQLHLV